MVTHPQEFRYETCWYDVISYEILNIYSNSTWNYNSAVNQMQLSEFLMQTSLIEIEHHCDFIAKWQ